jgi:hypothetical protein
MKGARGKMREIVDKQGIQIWVTITAADFYPVSCSVAVQ